MRYMLLLKGDPEPGQVPGEELISAMMAYNEELAKAGVLLAAEGLTSSASGARVTTRDGRKTVTDGPFAESKELIAGFLLIQVASREEAIEWASRCPVEAAIGPGQEAVVEVREVGEINDFPLTEQQRATQARLDDRLTG
jgi:hypothetical protein